MLGMAIGPRDPAVALPGTSAWAPRNKDKLILETMRRKLTVICWLLRRNAQVQTFMRTSTNLEEYLCYL
ncbi:hypothetical protein Y1Q_0014170 [Alligator mississippiensis]|uniref:Uncharacterized protein n=1 Tax=Alligator mississippiensis TaxID=8496 RepID=A0A151MTW8_ALLMI|nr:hypothetical protein Y1Q_0014170 [Alligator mississippiensis]